MSKQKYRPELKAQISEEYLSGKAEEGDKKEWEEGLKLGDIKVLVKDAKHVMFVFESGLEFEAELVRVKKIMIGWDWI